MSEYWNTTIVKCNFGYHIIIFYSHEWPLARQPGEVEPEELPLEAVVELDKLGIAPAEGGNRIKLFLKEKHQKINS